MFECFINDVCDAAVGTERGAKIKGAAKLIEFRRFLFSGLVNGGGKVQVAAEGLQNVLPWTCGDFIAHGDRLPSCERTNAVGHDAVQRPISTANDIACACGSEVDNGVRS